MEPSVNGAPSALTQTCFATQGQALAFATGNRKYASQDTAHARASAKALSTAPAAASASYIVGIDYMDTHYGGSDYIWSTTTRCNPNTFYTAKMPSGWGNDISSAINYVSSNCNFWLHYELENYKGATINCSYTQQSGNGCYNMDAGSDGKSMSDRTSSEKWFNGVNT